MKAALGKSAPKYDNPAELAADKGYHSRDALVRWTARFAAAFVSLSARASPTGTAMLKPAAQSTTIGADYSQQGENRCNVYVLSGWNEVSPIVLTAEACAECICEEEKI